MAYKAINWNQIEDVIDKATWEKLTEQFWLDTRIPISNDIDDWRKLSQQEKDLVAKVFGGLTLLDTLQSEVGVESLVPYARTQHEISVYRDVSLMEAVHAKSYSSILNGHIHTQRFRKKLKLLKTFTKMALHLSVKSHLYFLKVSSFTQAFSRLCII